MFSTRISNFAADISTCFTEAPAAGSDRAHLDETVRSAAHRRGSTIENQIKTAAVYQAQVATTAARLQDEVENMLNEFHSIRQFSDKAAAQARLAYGDPFVRAKSAEAADQEIRALEERNRELADQQRPARRSLWDRMGSLFS